MATLSKKIRMLEHCAAEDPERVIIELRDFWDFEYDVMDANWRIPEKPVRETVTISDMVRIFKEQHGKYFEEYSKGSDYKKIIEIFMTRKPVSELVQYEDTKKIFFEHHPDYYEEKEKINKIRQREFSTLANAYATPYFNLRNTLGKFW